MGVAEYGSAVIVGGGLAGLTAALHLAERGLRPIVLEADPDYAGGRLKGFPPVEIDHAGQRWSFHQEHGVHGIWSPYRNFQAMLSRHHIRPVLVPAQKEDWIHGNGSRVRRAEVGSAIRGSWIPAPFHYAGLFVRPRFLSMLGLHDIAALYMVLGGLLAALSIDPLSEEKALPGLTLDDFCAGWTPQLTQFFDAFTRNALPAASQEIPASGFIAFLRFYTLRRRDAWAFSYLPNGSGASLIDPLVATLKEHGGEIVLGVKVTRLERTSVGWRVILSGTYPSYLSTSYLSTQCLTLALDAPSTETLLRASPDTSAQAERLRLPAGRSTAIVRLWFDRSPSPPGAEAGIFSGDFILDNFFWLDRIYDDYIRWHRATGGSAIEAHIYGPPELLAQPDASLLTQAIVDVFRAWPDLKGRVIHSTLTRHAATHTLLSVGTAEEHLGVVTPWPHLFCCGDWVRDPNPALFMERACITGIKAANAVLERSGLATWPILPHPEPEPFARRVEAFMSRIRSAERRRRSISRPTPPK